MGTIPNKHRTVDVVPLLYEAVLEKVEPCDTNGGQCQLWTGLKKNEGYGRLKKSINGYLHDLLVHNVVWMATQNPIQTVSPQLSHLCHNKLCVNYTHIVAEPQSVNNQRKECNKAELGSKKYCKYGNSHYNELADGTKVYGFRPCLL